MTELSTEVYIMHLHNCLSSGSLTLYIRGSTYVLTTQTNPLQTTTILFIEFICFTLTAYNHIQYEHI